MDEKKYEKGSDGHTYCVWWEVQGNQLVKMVGHLECEKCEVDKVT